MIRLAKTSSQILVMLSMGGCVTESSDEQISMPLYEPCIDYIEGVQEEHNQNFDGSDRSIKIEHALFDVKSTYQSGVIGVITVSGSNLAMPIENYANRIKLGCYPEKRMILRGSSDSLSELQQVLKQNRNLGISESFIRLDDNDDEIVIFFYDDI